MAPFFRSSGLLERLANLPAAAIDHVAPEEGAINIVYRHKAQQRKMTPPRGPRGIRAQCGEPKIGLKTNARGSRYDAGGA
jgi:hypothetical protein